MFQRICLAAAISPRTEALLAESVRICVGLNASLTIIHVGSLTKEQHNFLNQVLREQGLPNDRFEINDEPGDPAEIILQVCRRKKADLLIAGALQREQLLQYYLGTVGRTILRKPPCSVLVLTNPQIDRNGFLHIGALADDTPYVKETLTAACAIGMLSENAKLQVIRDLKMYGLSLAATDQISETEYDDLQNKLLQDEIKAAEKILASIPHGKLEVNISVVSGKAGFEVKKFAKEKKLDLLVVGMPPRDFNFLDRIFKHDLEYLFADLPCNLMLIKPVQI